MYMPNSITNELLQQYKVINDLISNIELFSRAPSIENTAVEEMRQKL